MNTSSDDRVSSSLSDPNLVFLIKILMEKYHWSSYQRFSLDKCKRSSDCWWCHPVTLWSNQSEVETEVVDRFIRFFFCLHLQCEDEKRTSPLLYFKEDVLMELHHIDDDHHRSTLELFLLSMVEKDDGLTGRLLTSSMFFDDVYPSGRCEDERELFFSSPSDSFFQTRC